MGCPTQVTLGDNLVFSITTHNPSTGVLTDADSAPPYRVYEDLTASPLSTGSMAKLDDANTTGFYVAQIACTSGNGFEIGKSYTVYIEAVVGLDRGGISYAFNVEATKPTNFSSLVISAGGVVNSDVKAVDGNTEAATDLSFSARTIVRGSAVAGVLSTTQMTTDLTEATDDHYNGRIIIWTSGVLKDQATDITDYLGADKRLVYTAVTETPTAADTFVIV